MASAFHSPVSDVKTLPTRGRKIILVRSARYEIFTFLCQPRCFGSSLPCDTSPECSKPTHYALAEIPGGPYQYIDRLMISVALHTLGVAGHSEHRSLQCRDQACGGWMFPALVVRGTMASCPADARQGMDRASRFATLTNSVGRSRLRKRVRPGRNIVTTLGHALAVMTALGPRIVNRA